MRLGVSGSYKPHSTLKETQTIRQHCLSETRQYPFHQQTMCVCCVCAHICRQSGTPLQVSFFFFFAILLAVAVIQVSCPLLQHLALFK